MKRALIPLLILFAAAAAAADSAPLRIGRITINAEDVYTRSESRGFFYRTADRLHIETRESVVRKFLLFREGEIFNPVRLEETERNLRALHYLKSASVTALPPHDGVVDVVVSTQDAWSVAPETKVANNGGAGNYGASLSETNFLGLGKEAEVAWTKNIDRTRVGVHYIDPMLFRGYWNGMFGYGRTSDGYDETFVVRRPFYSFATRWSSEEGYVAYRRTDKLYANGEVSSAFEHEMQNVAVSWGGALHANDRFANRLTGGFRLQRDQFERIEALSASQLPQSRDYRYVFLRYAHAENDFIKLNFINKDIRIEDFNLGSQYAVEGALSPRAFGAPVNSAFACATLSKGVAFGPASFLIDRTSIESRFDGGIRNAVAAVNLFAVKRSGETHPTAFVGHIALSTAWRQDVDDQFFADGLNGLRGYRAHSFSGSRAVVMNLEQRWNLGRELLQLYSPGFVTFVDAGNATNGGLADLMRLKVDAGIGLRIGLPRTPKNLLRMDFAYAFNRDPLGRRGLLVSFSSGQAF